MVLLPALKYSPTENPASLLVPDAPMYVCSHTLDPLLILVRAGVVLIATGKATAMLTAVEL